MVVVTIDGHRQEITGRLATIITWLLKRRGEIASGHKTVVIECHGKVVKPTISEHFDPLSEN